MTRRPPLRSGLRDPAADAIEKPCTHCDVTRPLSEFPPARRMLDGRSSWCRACALAGTREWRAGVRTELNASRRAAYHASRRADYEPRACVGCGLVFTPNRVDKRYCCHLCGDVTRTYGQPGPAWAADHRASHEARAGRTQAPQSTRNVGE